MTTKHTPTPYDAEEADFQEWLNENGGEDAPRTPTSEWARAWRLGGAEGYRKALQVEEARHKALVEALKNLMAHPPRDETICLADISDAPCVCGGHDAVKQAQAALKQEEEIHV